MEVNPQLFETCVSIVEETRLPFMHDFSGSGEAWSLCLDLPVWALRSNQTLHEVLTRGEKDLT